MSTYNATVRSFRTNQETGEEIPWGTFVAAVEEINGRFQMLRANSVTCTGYEDRFLGSAVEIPSRTGGEPYRAEDGDAAFDLYLRATTPDLRYEIVLDNCAGYWNAVRGINLPPAYKR
jgi:hypothetical protein